MILEGIYPEEEKLDKAMERGHMLFREAAELAAAACAKELWLTHFSPAIDIPANYIDAARHVFANTLAGTDGLKKTLQFTE